MKNRIILLTVFALIFTACSGTASTTQGSSIQVSASLPIVTQLVLGTLKLEGTEQSVTSEQANELLVLWQVYQSLSNSDTAAQSEIDGLVKQIQETMTTDQMNAIQAMNLTQQDVFAAIQEQGGDFIQVQQSSSSTSTQSGGFAPPDGGGGMPGGGGEMADGTPPDGGMGDMGGAGPSAGTVQDQDVGSGAGATDGVSTVLVDVLIQNLEQIANS